MKLKRLIIIESLIMLFILITVAIVFQLTPYLQPSQQNSIGMFEQLSYKENILTIQREQSITKTFNYTSFDPAIIILNLDFQNCQTPGFLNIYCNYRKVDFLLVTPQNQSVTFNLFSCSGFDWIEPLSTMSGLNDLLFESPAKNGFEGTFTYQLSFRGSR